MLSGRLTTVTENTTLPDKPSTYGTKNLPIRKNVGSGTIVAGT